MARPIDGESGISYSECVLVEVTPVTFSLFVVIYTRLMAAYKRVDSSHDYLVSDVFDLRTCWRTARVRSFCEARKMFDLESNGSKICPFLQNIAGDILTKKRNQLSDNFRKGGWAIQ